MIENNQEKLYQRHNTDDILVRSVIAGLLDLLNNNISYSQIWNNDTVETVEVPWYYGFSHANNERFLQDNYTFFGRECFNNRKTDGDFNSYPKGIITYNGSKINASTSTNIFSTGTYMKNVNGVLTSYTSLFYSIPLDMTFDCTVYTSDTDFMSMLKIEQAIRETFYKNKSFYVLFRGMRVGCTVGFPEQHTFETNMELSYDNVKRENKLTFTLGVETYQPAFDETTEMLSDCSMNGIDVNISTFPQNDVYLKLLQPLEGNVTYAAGAAMYIQWKCKSSNKDLYSINLDWIDQDTYEEHNIAHGIYMHSPEYIWNIPQSISNFIPPEINLNTKDYEFIEKPIIKVVPQDGLITSHSFVVLSPGHGRKINDVNQVPFTIEYKDDDDNLIIDDNYYFNLNDNGEINVHNPVGLNNDPKLYLRSYEPKLISIKITADEETDIVKNILIV